MRNAEPGSGFWSASGRFAVAIEEFQEALDRVEARFANDSLAHAVLISDIRRLTHHLRQRTTPAGAPCETE